MHSWYNNTRMQSKNDQDVTIDNPQERLHFNIGYILGLIDGEGCYQLESDGRGHFYPSLTISNTDPLIIRSAEQYLKELGIVCWIWSPKFYGKERRPYLRLYVKGIGRMKVLLDLVTKYPHAKLERANILKTYCEHRLAIPVKELYRNGERDHTKEQELRKRLSNLNTKYKGAKSSETIRFDSVRNII